MDIWNIDGCRKNIASLFRNPGNYHEWMMISQIPRIKQMDGLDLNWITDFRDFTDSDFGGWKHGGNLSGIFHNLLSMAFWYANSPGTLADNLRLLKEETKTQNAPGLDRFIERLEQLEGERGHRKPWSVLDSRSYKKVFKEYIKQKLSEGN